MVALGFGKISRWAGFLALVGFLIGCENGPSKEQIRSDLDAWISGKTKWILMAGPVSIIEKNRVGSDRWIVHASVMTETVNSKVSEIMQDPRKRIFLQYIQPSAYTFVKWSGETLYTSLEYRAKGGSWQLDRIQDDRRWLISRQVR